MKKFFLLTLLLAVTGLVSGCANTFDGAGRDISKAGDKIQQTF